MKRSNEKQKGQRINDKHEKTLLLSSSVNGSLGLFTLDATILSLVKVYHCANGDVTGALMGIIGSWPILHVTFGRILNIWMVVAATLCVNKALAFKKIMVISTEAHAASRI